MSGIFTASFHNGGLEINGVDSRGRKRQKLYQACREHNIRDPKYCDKQDHIVKGGHHETWIDIEPKKAYEEIFGEAFREFNGKQKKKKRQFNSYWEKVRKSKELVPVREALITIGNCENIPDEETQKQIYKDFVEEFKKANPNMKVIGAYYHADEMRDDGNGGMIKGAPHLHLDYIPVAYKCERGQKVQNSMNGALLEQGILNLELDPEIAMKKFGLREKTKRKSKNQEEDKEPEKTLKERMKTMPKLETAEANPDGKEEAESKKTKPRVVTNLIQWTYQQRNLLMKIAREHGLTIENPNEKREHLNTEDYIHSKDKSLMREAYALAEKLLEDVKEVDSEKSLMIDWEKDLISREEATDLKDKKIEQKVKDFNIQVQKSKDYFDYREKRAKLKEKEAEDQTKILEEKEENFETAKKHVSSSLHKFVQKLKKRKKEISRKGIEVESLLTKAQKVTDKAESLKNTTATSYFDFADDIKMDEARIMASRHDGNGLCTWFNSLGHKFGAWLHKAEYFVKQFWSKTPEDLMQVAQDMKESYCKTLSEYIDKGMKAQTHSQNEKMESLKKEIPEIRRQTRKEIDWWD